MQQDEPVPDTSEPPPAPGRFAEVNAQIQSLFDDIAPQDRLAAGRSFYFDADGVPQLRRTKLRPVGDD